MSDSGIRWMLLAMLISFAGVILVGCAYSISDLAQLAPEPSGVTVKQPPEIVDAKAEITIIDQQDYGYWDEYWYCEPWWPYRCWWERYWVWTRTDVTANISIKLNVKDPSLDLNDNPTRVRVMDSEMPPGSSGKGTNKNVCLLNINQRDIALNKTDITGTGEDKIVSIKLKNVRMSFTPDCRTFAAEIPLRLIVDDHGVEVMSPTERRVTVIIKS